MPNSTSKKKVPIIEGLFTWPSDDPRLIASRCKKCGTLGFPKAPFCSNPDCEKEKENIEEILLSNKGKIWSWTVARYPPPAPFKYEPFEPFAIGMVDLPEGLRVYGIITSTENLRIGMDVTMVVNKLYEDEENEYVTWMWKPIG